MTTTVQRKLTTILAADAVEYSARMARDEVATTQALRAAREVFKRFIARHNGRIANTAGDGLIADFPSVVEAVQCAIEVQQDLPSDGLRFRIGIHLGDVIVDGDDLLGDGVNLAARLESMAEPGGVLISQQVYDQVHAKLSVGFDFIGERRPKNFPEDVPVYRITLGRASSLMERLGVARAEPDAPPAPKPPKPPKAQRRKQKDEARFLRKAGFTAVLVGGLTVLDLATGPGAWAYWPAIPLLALLGIAAIPQLVESSGLRWALRAAVLGVGFAAINALTWEGYPWALWPIGALTFVVLLLWSLRIKA